jgi:Na+-transporting NADH:ubiquinone oxidoreductase subunit C
MGSTQKTLLVATVLCIVCSVLVSTTAIILKPLQIKNAILDTKVNILTAAGLYDTTTDVDAIYSSKIEEKIINLESGKVLDTDPTTFNLMKAEGNSETSIKIKNDIAGINRRAKDSKIYFIKDNGERVGVILPIKSQGLWSIMRGFIALKTDVKTVIGFKYYSQGETPGLGAEVDNPKWVASWVGKHVFDENKKTKIALVKTEIEEGSAAAKHQIQAISGATITGMGVQTSLHYWLGDSAYGKFLDSLRKGEL